MEAVTELVTKATSSPVSVRSSEELPGPPLLRSWVAGRLTQVSAPVHPLWLRRVKVPWGMHSLHLPASQSWDRVSCPKLPKMPKTHRHLRWAGDGW